MDNASIHWMRGWSRGLCWGRRWWVWFGACHIWALSRNASIWHIHRNVELDGGIIWVWSLRNNQHTGTKWRHTNGWNVSEKHYLFDREWEDTSTRRFMRTTFYGGIAINKGSQVGMTQKVGGKSGKWECHKDKRRKKCCRGWSWTQSWKLSVRFHGK